MSPHSCSQLLNWFVVRTGSDDAVTLGLEVYLANLEPQTLPGTMDIPAIVQLLQQHLPADTVLTNGAGNSASWMHRFFKH